MRRSMKLLSALLALLLGASAARADATDFEFEGITTRTSFEAAILTGARWLDGSLCGPDSLGSCRVPQ